ncbi:helix-turn-helix transcriptional regulator [Rhodococcus sp. UNC363MFTsu5.1]|uniref:helix-turn-helix transcriptional regulator n=1 Tax=Rhodococcus sp. UNC363MFTsu5.1 TaxID=1449069 RepID=UPI000A59C65C|nr:LuxR family transcriptional regulator [Rhodococcus sp. UNC363MFTsu5.1]
MSDAWPLIGRVEELRLIAEALGGSGGYAGVVLGGAAGVGKSRLAREAVASAASARCAVRWVVGSNAARGVPLGALTEWVPAESADPLSLVRKVISALVDTDHKAARVVVAVDDAQLLDDLSAFVVQQLVHRRLASVVVTIRAPEHVPETITGLWKDGHLQRVELQPLSRDECKVLLESVLGGPLDPLGSRRMWDLTRGNLLFLRHVVEQERRAGRLRRDDGTWTWRGEVVVSPTLNELIERAMGVLPVAVAEVLDVLAVGEPLTGSQLVEMAESSAIEEAESRGLIVVDGDSESVRLAHPLYGDARRGQAGQLRLRRLRGLVASHLRPGSDRVVDPRAALRRAVLVLDSDLEPDPAEMIRAAEIAGWYLDQQLALRLAKAATTSGGWLARLIYAAQLSNIGRGEESQEILETLSSANVPDDVRALIAFVRVFNLFLLLGQPDDARAVLDDAVQRYTQPMAAAIFAAARAVMAIGLRKPAEAVLAAEQAAACAELPPLPAMLAVIAHVIGLGELGRADELGPVAERADRIGSSATAVAFHRLTAAEFHSTALRLAGYLTESAGVIDRIRGHSQTPDALVWIELMSGCAEYAAGRAESASRRISSVLPLCGANFEAIGVVYRYRIDLLAAYAVSGDREAAARTQRELSAHPHRMFAVTYQAHEMLAEAWLTAARGEVSTAIAQARRGADVAATNSHLTHEACCLEAATRFGDSTTTARLTELAALVDGPRVKAAAAHAAALAGGDGDGLGNASGMYEAFGDLLGAADVAAQASIVHARNGRRGAALTAAARARNLAEQCGHVHTPALSAAAGPANYSDRQREVVLLAAQGLTNRQIAQRLSLSVRTVEGHLYRASNKSGVSGRTELGQTLGVDPQDQAPQLE